MKRVPARPGANLLFPLSLGGPPLAWQLLFFLVPFGFLVAVTFWSVRNFRLTPDFIIANWVHIPIYVSLLIILGSVAAGIGSSLWASRPARQGA